jgi:CheY-like chemotaxis protein
MQKFIAVDDDPISNLLSRIVIEDTLSEADIQTYTDPEAALAYIKSNYLNGNAPDTFLFLDINMPTLSGWEFLDVFDLFDQHIKEKLKVYILSSSVDPRDKQRAGANKSVIDYFEKPLTKENIKSLSFL